MTEQLSENIPVTNNPAEATLPSAPEPAESLDTYENIVGVPKAPPIAPPTIQPPPVQQQAPTEPPPQEPNIMEQPLDKITMAQFINEVYKEKKATPEGEQAPPVPEEAPEEDELEVMSEQEISEQFRAQIKAAMPYLDDDDVALMADTQAKMVRPMAEQNLQLYQEINNLKAQLQPVIDGMQQQAVISENQQVLNQMEQIHPDIRQLDPVMDQVYYANRDALNQLYNFDNLPKPAKAEILYGIVKGMGAPAPPALQRPPAPQPQIRQQHSTLPPPTANLPGSQANARPVDRLMGDVLGLFEGKAPR